VERALLTIVLSLCASACGGSAATSTPGAAPQAVAPDIPAEWQTVADWSGSGIKQTESFVVGSREWRIYWKAKNEAFPGAGIIHVSVHQADTDEFVASVASRQGTGRDISYVRAAPGRYYLSINSANVDWLVRVEDQRALPASPPALSERQNEMAASMKRFAKSEAARRNISEQQSETDQLTMFVGTFINNGFISAMEDDSRAIYLDGDFWKRMGREQNELMLSQFSDFRKFENR
jgi:hypothetical protein